MRRGVVLLSGGLDSATVLAIARADGFECHALTVRYGQRHVLEVERAAAIARSLGAASHVVVEADLSFLRGSALTDRSVPVPKAGAATPGIPPTYVPARNTILLALALAFAESIGARDLFVGVNAVDYSGYPDCRPDFLRAFESLARLATRAGVEGDAFSIRAPLVDLSKAEIVRRAVSLGVDVALTLSCYDPGTEGEPCGRCDSCRLRAKGFAEAGLTDPGGRRV
jgi:7-cyano-7-deazaguanine synthase